MTTNHPQFKNFPVLSSKQILLRQVIIDDADEIMEISYYDGIQASNANEAIEMQKR